MAQINNQDRDVFSNAYKSILDNFTPEEQERIGELAGELKSILEAAIRREQEKLKRPS